MMTPANDFPKLGELDQIRSRQRGPAGPLRRNLVLGGVMALSFLAMPTESRADIFGVFSALFSLITGPIGTSLTSITGNDSDTQSLNMQVVWPLDLLNRARGFVAGSIQGNRAALHQIFQAPVQSATLSGPQEFEALLHSRDSNQMQALQTSFSTNYGSVSTLGTAAPEDRVMMDIDDALGQESLEATLVSDQAQDQILITAEAIENQAALTTPGDVPFITAQAQVANLRSQAYIQKMLAAQLRQEAGRLAHDSATLKRNAGSVSRFGTNLNAVLSRSNQ